MLPDRPEAGRAHEETKEYETVKKIVIALLVCLIMLVSAAMAEDLSALSDQELITLHQEVLTEMAARGIEYLEDASAGPEQDTAERNAMLGRLVTFFSAWSSNNLDDMLPLCASDWKENCEQPRTELFVILANRTPQSLTSERVSGSPGDPVRTVTAAAMIDRNNGKSAALYRLRIVMKKEEDGLWYIDPSSLLNAEDAEREPLPVPTAEPAADIPEESENAASGMVLYYVPEGGSYYHVDQNCKTVHPKYRPIQGHFTEDRLNDEPYSVLQPCSVCGAPERPE